MNTQGSTVIMEKAVEYPDPAVVMRDAETVIASLGEAYETNRAKIHDLQERLAEGRFHLAVLGQFKRGKSTLLNALLGEALLPTAVIPLTAIPTYVRFGSVRSAKVSFNGDRAPEQFIGNNADEIRRYLTAFVSEEANPNNRLQVSMVEVTAPGELLEKGVVLIDTPGIGSTHRHNTEATLNFLPQCDAAMFLVSADPPITEVEVDFLKEVRLKVKRLFFILNKIDYLTATELDSVISFCNKIITEKAEIKMDLRMFPISAKQGLEAVTGPDRSLWIKSGMKEVEDHLTGFLAIEKTRVLREAIARKTGSILEETLMSVRLEVRSMEMPLKEIEEKLVVFENSIGVAERQRIYAKDILAGERRRLLEYLEAQAENLRMRAHAYMQGIASEKLSGDGGDLDENRVREAIAVAIPVFFERELGEMSRSFDKRVSESLGSHRKRSDELIEAVRKAAAEIFEIPYRQTEKSVVMETKREPYWVTHQWHSSLVPIPDEWVDRILPYRTRLKRIRKRINHQINDLVLFNVENLRWATLQNLDTTFRNFISELDARLGDTVNATKGAIVAALEKKRTQRDRVEGEIQKFQKAIETIEGLIQRLG